MIVENLFKRGNLGEKEESAAEKANFSITHYIVERSSRK
jgi:hypothetical protein